MNAQPLIADVLPTLRYRDAPAALKFLEDGFGFKPTLVVPGDDNTIAHAELTFGTGMIMLGSHVPGDCGDHMAVPVGGASIYVVIADGVDEHLARAVAAGATVVSEPKDEDHGGRSYAARDPEGNLWSFGTYRPSV
jgi:uncharacterized glyoxalase superfamily protein PhnB